VKLRLRLILLVAAILLALFVTLLLQPRSAIAEPPAIAADPKIITASGWVDASGGVQKLGIRADGVLLAVPVREGDTVEAGAVLARLDSHQLDLDARGAVLHAQRRQLEFAALSKRLALAREEVSRLKPLVEAQAEAADTLRTAQAQLAELESSAQLAKLEDQAAQLKRDQLESNQARQLLRAPARGEILRVFVHAGEAVTAGAPIVSFVADGPLWVRAELDERLFGRVQPGMAAEVSPEYDDSHHFPAKVLRIARAVGPVQALPDVRPAAKDDRVVEVVLELEGKDLLIGQRVLVRIGGTP
jgi:HlyD family secretion protein